MSSYPPPNITCFQIMSSALCTLSAKSALRTTTVSVKYYMFRIHLINEICPHVLFDAVRQAGIRARYNGLGRQRRQ